MRREALFSNEVGLLEETQTVRNNRRFGSIFAMLLMFCFVATSVFSNNSRATANSGNEPFPDEVDSVMQAASAAIQVLDAFKRANNQETKSTQLAIVSQTTSAGETFTKVRRSLFFLKSLSERSSSSGAAEAAFKQALEKMKEAAEQQKKAAEIDYAVGNLEGTIKAIPLVGTHQAVIVSMRSVAVEYQKLVAEAKRNKELLEDQIKRIDEQIALIKEQIKKLELIIQKLEELLPKFLEFAGSDTNAEGAKKCVSRISQDRSYATKLLAATRANINNPSGLTSAIKKDSPGSNIDVREVKDANGLMVIFRIGHLTHCLSTKQQCGGKPYSLTK